jgi:hypothetical protein
MSARIFLLLLLTTTTTALAVACGCSSNGEPTTRSSTTTAATTAPARSESINPPSTQMMTQTGTLRGGMMAIGGETTGWTLVGDGAVGGIELDVSKVQEAAKRLDGKRVNVSGRTIDKQYVERGKVRMMSVEKIEEAK